MLSFLLATIVLGVGLSTADTVPYSTPLSTDQVVNLFKRGTKCDVSCASMGAEVCCGKKSVCALDQAGNVACCPKNSVCTGTIAAGPAPTNAPVVAAAAASASAPPSAASPGSGISHAISGTSTISNQYYPFPVLPTPFANAGDCTSAYSDCQAESAKCTGFIEGGGYGVTIGGQQGQITQQAAMPASSAESICSSLSQQACHGLALSQCPSLTGGKASASGGGFVMGDTSNAGAVPTNYRALCGMGVGIALGIAHQGMM